MVLSPKLTQQPWNETYSEIIDVRSPSEFEIDRMPEAINLPVLSDEERVKVGTIYKQVNPFEARKIGAALTAQNIARHLELHFAAKPRDYAPLVYCWRGGQRSQSLAGVLAAIGWSATVVDGGYKTYRAYVRSQLERVPDRFTYRILAGATGSGKTHILQRLAQLGAQVLDLEALANHRGSLLGEVWDENPTPQPSQKAFESRLLRRLQHFDPSVPVWVESESNKIGQVYLPPALWNQMKQASGVEIELAIEHRVNWLLQEYDRLGRHGEFLATKLEGLTSRHGRKKVDQWYDLIRQRDGKTLVADLLASHYDPSYRRSLGQCYPHLQHGILLPDLSPASVDALCDRLLGDAIEPSNSSQAIE
ncbi:tRNA 2-selenouridine(34) synthase MnmH [Oscillatoriales cyanobacterium LEGE 11467]|uniref:tRNA 2-selenouridine(34) synthase MnmH n=1 Tax=Zarconia navalis LEGE 11467 TaxID=1828826 RepID=A0A928VSN9_9CYAN|nr:tRNA 2-selenouridine(34) synthase MnmH [Zarconia navalis]MBE9039552.1 tRNA 2-selenouridine(34) synthase MnmH [Zarconia navalis LEGE 11467]